MPASLIRAVDDPGVGDGLRLRAVSFVPEIWLYLADDPTVLWARLEAGAHRRLMAPYWASAWSGGQALARYVLDHPALVAGRSVLDIASGSGLNAIAAAVAGASTVVANDIDPYAMAAITANAAANRVRIVGVQRDLLDGDGEGADVVLAGDGLYEPTLAVRVLAFLGRAAARGALVLVGDPGRGHVAMDRLEPVEIYEQPHLGPAEDHQKSTTAVFRLAA